MILLGFTGPIGHGKTTFSNALAQLEPSTVLVESHDLVIEVANAWHRTLTDIPRSDDLADINSSLRVLPDILRQHLRVQTSYEQIALQPNLVAQHPVEYQKLFQHLQTLQGDPSLVELPITGQNKDEHRPILQWLGGYLVQTVDAGLWYKEIVRRAHQAEQQGCKLCLASGLRYATDAQIIRDADGSIIKLIRPGLAAEDLLDPTERERDSIQADCTIINNGTIQDLETCAKTFWQDVQAGNLAPEYTTSQAAT